MEELWKQLKVELDNFTGKIKSTIFSRFQRIIEVEKVVLLKNDKGQFEPLLKKGQLINVEFINQGSVLDENHPAIVWAADKKSEHIIVIPLTSKNGDGRFEKRNLGVINGYNNLQSIVKINQPQSVSRKSVTLIKNKKNKNVVLSDSQLIKFEDYFREYYLKEPNLRDIIQNKIGTMLPLEISEEDIIQSYRPVIYDVRGDELWYRFSNEDKMKKIDLVSLRITFTDRNKIIENIFSDDKSVVESTFKDIQERMQLEKV
jgi:hypothetical protein